MTAEERREAFSERIRREALEETARVLDDLERLRAEAREVQDVLLALRLPVDERIVELTRGVTGPVQPPEQPPVVEPPAVEDKVQPPEESTRPEPTPADDEPSEERQRSPLSDAAKERAARANIERSDANRAKVIDALRRAGSPGLRTGEVADLTRLSSPTVTKHLRALVEEGLAYQRDNRWVRIREEVRDAGMTAPETPPEAEKEPTPPPAADKPKKKKSPVFPGIEAIPEHLRHMPAAKTNTAPTARIKAAEGQLKVYDFMATVETAVVGEVLQTINDMPQSRVKAYLDELTEAGLLQRVGFRHPKWVKPGDKAGRTSVAFRRSDKPALPGSEESEEAAPEEEGSPQSAEPQPPPAPSATETPPPPSDAVAFAKVRDAVVKNEGQFSPAQIARATELPIRLVREGLAMLMHRKAIKFVGMDDLELYEYQPPNSMGRAAELDQQRRPAPTGGNGGSAPVAGTGVNSRIQVNNSEVRDLVRAAERAGATVEHTSSGHIAVKIPNGRRVLISHTPRTPRSVANDRARLRREGLDV